MKTTSNLLAPATARLQEATHLVRVEADYNDFIGNPGHRFASGTPAAEAAYRAARDEYVRAYRAHHASVYGPMLRDYYFAD